MGFIDISTNLFPEVIVDTTILPKNEIGNTWETNIIMRVLHRKCFSLF